MMMVAETMKTKLLEAIMNFLLMCILRSKYLASNFVSRKHH